MQVIQTYCHQCHMKCKVHVSVEEGRVRSVESYNCVKGRYAVEDIYRESRLRFPLRRTGEKGEGKWQRITWDDAFGLMAEKFGAIRKVHGPQALCSITGCLHKETSAIASMLFAYLMGSPNVLDVNLNCNVSDFLAQVATLGDMISLDRGPDYANAACIVLWGANPLATRPPQGALISSRKRQGAKLVVVDPRPTYFARRADVWLQPRPGTDAALALAMIRIIINEELYDRQFVAEWCLGFEELRQHVQSYTPERVAEIAWVPAERIVAAARLLATTKPAAFHNRLGTSAQVNSTQTGRALAILMVLGGNLDVPGGNLLSHPLGGFKVIFGMRNCFRLPDEAERHRVGFDQFPMQCGTQETARARFAAHTPVAIKSMLDGRLRGMFIAGSNVVSEEANSRECWEALGSLEFLAVSELSMTPTAELADVVLPAAHWLETEGPTCGFTGSYNTILGTTRVKEPEGECLDDRQIVLELARRMGLPSPWQTIEDLHNLRLHDTGISWEELIARPERQVEFPLTYRKYENIPFKTPSGKVELASSLFQDLGYEALPSHVEPPQSPVSTPEIFVDYPFILTQFRHLEFENTEYHHVSSLKKRKPHATIEMNPAAAARLGITNGNDVWISTPHSSHRITAKARLIPNVHPQVVCMPHGWWLPDSPTTDHGAFEHNLNAIVSNGPPYDPINGNYHVRGILCAIGKADSN